MAQFQPSMLRRPPACWGQHESKRLISGMLQQLLGLGSLTTGSGTGQSSTAFGITSLTAAGIASQPMLGTGTGSSTGSGAGTPHACSQPHLGLLIVAQHACCAIELYWHCDLGSKATGIGFGLGGAHFWILALH